MPNRLNLVATGSNPCGYPHKPLVSYRINRQLSGWIPPPLMIRAFGAHCQQRRPYSITWSAVASRIGGTSRPSARAVLRLITSSTLKFFWGAVSINFEKRCNHYRLILACMLSGVSRDRPMIVGWSTAPRGQVIEESLWQLPKKLAAGPRVLARTESLRTQSGTKQGGPLHDHWAELGQIRYTRSKYAFVVIALFSMKFIAPASRCFSAVQTVVNGTSRQQLMLGFLFGV
jgi:hypothetical protein